MKFLKDTQAIEFLNKRVLVRVDYNVSLIDGILDPSEAFRIERTMPTIKFLLDAGASVILISHIGRSGETLAPVGEYLKKQLGDKFKFIPDLLGDIAQAAVAGLVPGQVILLENLRQNPGEEANDIVFGGMLASCGELFVQDAFSNCHREHASMVGIPKLLPSYAGLLLSDEITHLDKALTPESPSLLVMAGLKFETKLSLIKKLLPLYSHVLLGGGLLNTFLQRNGIAVGASIYDETADLSDILNNSKIIIPEKLVVDNGGVLREVELRGVGQTDVIMDVVIDLATQSIAQVAKTIAWNGPLGWYEKGAVAGTKKLLETCNPLIQSVIVGGGDTVTLVRELAQENNVTFLSTGGGAMLEYLELGTLPAIDALK